MTGYFQLLYAEEEGYEPYGVAYASPEVDRFLIPAAGTRVDHWKPVNMELRDGTFPDYLANNKGWRLCSEQLKDILERHRSPKDAVQWLDLVVANAGAEQRIYHALHFPESYPVINHHASLLHGDVVVKPALDADAICNHNLFCLPRGRRTIVSRKIKRAIEVAGLTGMSFSRVKVV